METKQGNGVHHGILIEIIKDLMQHIFMPLTEINSHLHAILASLKVKPLLKSWYLSQMY